jgi:hypothetical protein
VAEPVLSNRDRAATPLREMPEESLPRYAPD